MPDLSFFAIQALGLVPSILCFTSLQCSCENFTMKPFKKQGAGPERSAFGQMFTLYPLNPAVPHRIMEKNERSPGEPSRSHI